MNYEITFICKEETDPGVKKAIESSDGKIVSNFTLGQRKFAYPIKKEESGVYMTYIFQIPSEKLAELGKKISDNSKVMRFLLVQKKPAKITKRKPVEIEKIKPVEKAVVVEEEVSSQEIEMAPAVKEEVTKPAPVKKTVITKPKKVVAAKKQKVEKTPDKPISSKEKEEEVTKEDRLKALEEKLSQLLKD